MEIIKAEFRESQSCDKENGVTFGKWISKVPERGLVRIIPPAGVQAEACRACEHWKGLEHFTLRPGAEIPSEPEFEPKKKPGRPKKKVGKKDGEI